MGYYHSTYFGFGAKIAENAYSVDRDQFEYGGLWYATLVSYDVGHLAVGDYDRDKLFLTTYVKDVDLGSYMRVDPFSLGHQEGMWKHNLQMVADEIGMELLEEPAWFCIPDLS